MTQLTLANYQMHVDRWIQTFGNEYFGELTNMAILCEEVGEVSRLIARGCGEQTFKPGEKPDSLDDELADELADVLFIVSCIANQRGLDLTEAVHKNFRKKSLRDANRYKQAS